MKTTKPLLVGIIQYFSLVNFFSSCMLVVFLAGWGLYDFVRDPHRPVQLTFSVRQSAKKEVSDTVEVHAKYAIIAEGRNLQLRAQTNPRYVFLLPVINIRMMTLSLPVALLFAGFSWILFRAMQQLDISQPFTKRNAQRVITLAWLLIAIDTVKIIQLAISAHIVATTSTETYQYLPFFSGDYLKIGFALLVVGWIFKSGIALQQEQELTV
jgi:hypothetical protein